LFTRYLHVYSYDLHVCILQAHNRIFGGVPCSLQRFVNQIASTSAASVCVPDKCLLPYHGGCDPTRFCVSTSSGANCGECLPGFVDNGQRSCSRKCIEIGSCPAFRANSLAFPDVCKSQICTVQIYHAAISTFTFESENFVFAEGDSNPVEVCVTLSTISTGETSITVTSEDGTASVCFLTGGSGV
jgi:hypothetical protein